MWTQKTRNLPVLFLLFLLASLPWISPCHGYDIEDEYGFASHLIATKDYDQALLSLRRYIMFSENHEQVTKALFVTGSVFDIQKQHDRAAASFLSLATDPDQPANYREHAGFMAAQSMFLNKDLAGFHVQLDEMATQLDLSESGDEYRRYLKGFLGVYAGSTEVAAYLPVDSTDPQLSAHARDLQEKFRFWETHPSKNPVTAGLLSTVIPGAGQFYNGRYWDGGVAMGVVLGGAYWTHDLFDRGEDSWGWTVGVVTGLLYFGQVRNSIIDAVKINERNELEFKQHLIEDYFLRFTLSVKEDDLRFGISFR